MDDERTWHDQQDSLDYGQWKAEEDWRRANASALSTTMDTNLVTLQINAAIQLLAGIRDSAATLPAKARREIMGLNYIDDIIHRLQVARAEVNEDYAHEGRRIQ